MRIAYCPSCSPKAVVAVNVPAKIQKREHVLVEEKDRKGKAIKVRKAVWKDLDAPAPTHLGKDGKVHQAKAIEVEDAPRQPGEDPQAYLDRLGKTFAAKMV